MVVLKELGKKNIFKKKTAVNKKSGWKFPGVFLILCFEIHLPIFSKYELPLFQDFEIWISGL